MNESAPSPLYLGESPAAVPLPRVVERAYLWAVGGIGGLAAGLLLMLAVANQSSTDARRLASSDTGYLGSVVLAVAAGYSRKPF